MTCHDDARSFFLGPPLGARGQAPRGPLGHTSARACHRWDQNAFEHCPGHRRPARKGHRAPTFEPLHHQLQRPRRGQFFSSPRVTVWLTDAVDLRKSIGPDVTAATRAIRRLSRTCSTETAAQARVVQTAEQKTRRAWSSSAGFTSSETGTLNTSFTARSNDGSQMPRPRGAFSSVCAPNKNATGFFVGKNHAPCW